MGLFKRGRDAASSASPGSPGATDATPSFGHAAFDPADVEDARRGRPAFSLQPFAESNGFEFTDSEIYSGFVSTLPVWPQYTFNMCRGMFPGGRLGQVGHELLEVEAAEGSVRDSGTYYDVRVTTRRSLREFALLGPKDPENVPFAGNAVWIPTTTAHVRAPEINQLPVLSIRNGQELSVFGKSSLDRHGLPGFRLVRGPKDDDVFLSAMARAFRTILANRSDAYITVRAKYGIVALTVNGFRSSEQELQALIEIASTLGQGLVDLCTPTSSSPFSAAGPAAGSMSASEGVPQPHPDYAAAYAKVAGELNLLHEDQRYLTHLLPGCPIPGVASGVLFGTLPGTSTAGRIVWFEHGGVFSGTVRGGVIVPATPGASTPLGGIAHQPTGTRVEVVDGIAYCWKIKRFTGSLESRQLPPDAAAAFAAAGVATI